jgi:thiamine biosynthesis protein ThiS
MNVTLKLYATLSDYLPAEARTTNAVSLSVDPEVTVDEVIQRYHLPPKLTHLVLINGHFVPPGERKSRRLSEGDTLAIWPPIAGG